MNELLNNSSILTVVLGIGTFAALFITKYFLKKIGLTQEAHEKRVYYISKTINFIIIVIAIFLCAAIWGMKFDGILIFISSIFAVVGIALFAQWSILSNLTSSIIIFFTFPAKVGETIRILDGDNTVSGKIKEISLFQIHILDEEENLIIYPNNLFIQKPIIKINKPKVNDV